MENLRYFNSKRPKKLSEYFFSNAKFEVQRLEITIGTYIALLISNYFCLGIEFWSNVCDEEVDLSIEAEEAQDMNRPPEHVSRFYAKGALQFIVPILMQTLTKQEEFDDDDDWNPCKAAGVCLMLLATCCGDDIVNHCLPFVREHIKHADWR